MKLDLRPYQVDALDRSARFAADGVRRQLLVAATGLGKGLAVGTPVLLADGRWAPVEALAVGDLVVGVDGEPNAVTGVFDRGDQPAFEVETDDGVTVTVDADHLWTVATDSDLSRGRPWRTLDTATLAAQGAATPSGRLRWRLPVVEPVAHPAVPLPIHPYVLGVLIADGSLAHRSVEFTPGDDEIAERVALWLPDDLHLTRSDQPDRPTTYRIVSGQRGRGRHNPYRVALDDLGLTGKSPTRRIPPAYFAASVLARRQLLAGLLDCDGWTGEVTQYTTSSPGLADDVQALVRSLGGVARITCKPEPRYTHRGEQRTGQPAYAVTLRLPPESCPFHLSRKAVAWVDHRDRLAPTRKIREVRPAGVAHTVCIKVASADGLFVTDGYVVTHNTVIISAMAERTGGRTLVLAHRDELVNQAAAKIREVWPEVPSVGIVKGAENDVGAHVVVASVQTVSRPNRLAGLARPATMVEDPLDALFAPSGHPPFDLVVVDEAHHASADTYRAVLDHVGAGRPDGPLLVGVTATPDRGDGRGLDDVFDEVVANYDLVWGIRAGYLSDLRGKRVVIDGLDVSQIRTTRGDYSVGDTGRALEAAGAPMAIAQAIVEHAPGRRTLAFLPTVETSRDTAAACAAVGLRAAHIDGTTDTAERRSTLRAFARGEYDVVANCMVLTEGFDDPGVDCVVVGRLTKSRALYTQMIGRGTRKYPGKADCLVLDMVGVTDTHKLVTVPSLFGLDKARRSTGATDGTALLSELVAEHEADEIAAGRIRAEDVELFAQVRAAGRMAWVATSKPGHDRRRYTLQVSYAVDRRTGARASTVLVMVQLDRDNHQSWAVQVQHRENHAVTSARTLIREVGIETAQGVGEDYARKHGQSHLTSPDAAWRQRPPTPKQLNAAKRWGIKPADIAGKNAGELSDLITERAERRTARRRGAPTV